MIYGAEPLAEELQASPAFVAGLRLAPAGERLVTRLALPDVRSVEAELRVGPATPMALGFEQLARAQGLRTRAEMVWRKMAPTPEFVRDSDPRAAAGRLGLVGAYMRRLVWLVGQAPRGFRAWYCVRRSIRRDVS